MPIFNKEVEIPEEKLIKVSQGWGMLAANATSCGQQFNIDGAYMWFDGTMGELHRIVREGYKKKMYWANKFNDADERKQLIEWINDTEN